MTLLSLAERVEAATGPDRELFGDVWDELFPVPEQIWITDSTGDWTPEYSAWRERGRRFWDLLEAEAWLDAALTLVPDGCAWSVADPANRDGSKSVFGYPSRAYASVAGSSQPHHYGATPPLALTAACLRARAGEG